jgi:hypothetical protein
MNFRIFLILIIVLLSNFFEEINLFSQKLPKKMIEKPRKYQQPVKPDFKTPVDTSPTNETLPNQQWIVYSDRDNNPTYKSSTGNQKFKTLNFLDDFFVAEEKGDWLHIVKDPNPDFLNFSNQADDYGWIRKSNLILWQHCLVTSVGFISQKAMILNTVEHLKSDEGGRPDIVEFRSSPIRNAPKTGHLSLLYKFFFIFKIEGKSVLLAEEERITDNQKQRRKNVVGWAPSSRLTFWNHRKAMSYWSSIVRFSGDPT